MDGRLMTPAFFYRIARRGRHWHLVSFQTGSMALCGAHPRRWSGPGQAEPPYGDEQNCKMCQGCMDQRRKRRDAHEVNVDSINLEVAGQVTVAAFRRARRRDAQ